jgi:hypothetical protein
VSKTEYSLEQIAQQRHCVVCLPRDRFAHCQSLADASDKLRKKIKALNLGASDLDSHCGEVYEHGRIIARVSYNGRIWKP